MYSDRLRTLTRAYRNAERNNQAYTKALNSKAEAESRLLYAQGMAGGLSVLNSIIAHQENIWQDSVLRKLEAEIMQALSYVYPEDGYSVELTTRVLRGKVHVEGTVRSYFTKMMPGELSDSQGCLFQQIVSFAALTGIMDLMKVSTVYIDEAFSGVAKSNISKITALLEMYQKRGLNIVLIAQDRSIASGIPANILFLERSIDNKTRIHQQGVD